MKGTCSDVGVIDEIWERGNSVPRRITSRILVHVLVEKLDRLASEYALINGIGRCEVFAIDGILGEAAGLERVLWERKVVH